MKKLFKIIRIILLVFFVSSISMVVIYRFVPVYYTPLMVIRCVQQKIAGKPLKLQHQWVSKEHISPHLPMAVIASEDNLFAEHHGFDFEQIEKAIEERKQGKRQRGASTISQQTAKNVFLWPGGGWFRKGLEAYFTILIELMWDKHRIMEVYLNCIEMGDGIYGADAVAWQHFGRGADRLTRACALIAATLPNPLKFSSKEPSPYMLRRQTQIMRQMRNLGKLNWEDQSGTGAR